MDEKELIQRILKGEKECFKEIIIRYKSVVYNHSRNFLRNTQEAEDVTQEIFINVFNNLKKFRGDSKLSTWIYRITVNTCKNRLKQMKRLKANIIEEVTNEENDESRKLLEDVRENEEKTPDNVFMQKNIRDVIYKNIQKLPEEQKTVIILKDIDNLSYEEIAKTMKISVSAVKSKLFRARENLREKIEREGII
ncbi:MAG: sigma-70 family RNA polymerase sigma factor [Candidatus Goldbacteria bacterium]|nr:sigma-70 family RNA polymerase sigma factor [Candidatus Goldiibacteriota bacterium]